MKTENANLKKMIEELTKKNKERQSPYAERLVKEVKINSKKIKYKL